MDLKCGDRKAARTQRQEVGAVLDLAPVPGVLVNLALGVRGALVKIFAVEFTLFVDVGSGREEARRRHLFLVPADHHSFGTVKGRHRVLD